MTKWRRPECIGLYSITALSLTDSGWMSSDLQVKISLDADLLSPDVDRVVTLQKRLHEVEGAIRVEQRRTKPLWTLQSEF